jgi:hypothetical protein
MGAGDQHDTHGLGYESVDDDPNAAVLLHTMDATATWEATQQLRAWERERRVVAGGSLIVCRGVAWA